MVVVVGEVVCEPLVSRWGLDYHHSALLVSRCEDDYLLVDSVAEVVVGAQEAVEVVLQEGVAFGVEVDHDHCLQHLHLHCDLVEVQGCEVFPKCV